MSLDMMIVPGLRNIGSSCYANAIFQALAPLLAFQSHLQAITQYKRHFDTRNDKTSQTTISFWDDLFSQLWLFITDDRDENIDDDFSSTGLSTIKYKSISEEILSILKALCVSSSASNPPAPLRLRIQAIGDLSEVAVDYPHASAAALVQQDAHEFLLCLLSAISERDAIPTLFEAGEAQKLQRRSYYFQRWVTSKKNTSQQHIPYLMNTTYLLKENTGQVKSMIEKTNLLNPFRCVIGRRIVCLACSEDQSFWKSHTEEALTLDPPSFPSLSHSIESILATYFSANKISGYICDNSQCSHVAISTTDPRRTPQYNALRISTLLEPPTILTLHIGRLQLGHKVHTHFRISETLNLSPFILREPSSKNKNKDKEDDSVNSSKTNTLTDTLVLYDLLSVVEHLGNAESGHYITYRRISPPSTSVDSQQGYSLSSEWVVCSDGSVRNVAFKDVASSCAYLLFYERRR
jgi:ubiquitin C-terminal hydrolase